MPLPTKKGYVALDGQKLGEVIDVTVTDSPEEEDTSIIGRDEADYAPRTEVDYGPETIVVNMYVDPTDPQQDKLVRGAIIDEVVDYPVGNQVGMRKDTYKDCKIITVNDGTRAFKGRWKQTATMRCNGGRVRTRIT